MTVVRSVVHPGWIEVVGPGVHAVVAAADRHADTLTAAAEGGLVGLLEALTAHGLGGAPDLAAVAVEDGHLVIKLLEAPGAARMIAIMADHGFIAAILGRAPRIGTLARLVAQDVARNRPADPLLRLSVLAVAVEEDRAHLTERLRLSREEARSLVVVDPRLMALAALDARGRRRALYTFGAEAWPRQRNQCKPRRIAASAKPISSVIGRAATSVKAAAAASVRSHMASGARR